MGGSSVSLLKPSNSFIIFVSILVLQACHHRLIICQVMPPSPPPSQDLMFLDQRLAAVYPVIQQFKNTVTADPSGITNSWVGPGICNYTGFYCDNPPDNLTATALAGIDFNGYHLGAPTLEGFLDQLPDLAIFHANSNNFSGVIPQKIAQLPYFYELDVSNNNFSGAFPAAVFGVNLSFLDIRFNSFTGSVPPQVHGLNPEEHRQRLLNPDRSALPEQPAHGLHSLRDRVLEKGHCLRRGGQLSDRTAPMLAWLLGHDRAAQLRRELPVRCDPGGCVLDAEAVELIAIGQLLQPHRTIVLEAREEGSAGREDELHLRASQSEAAL
ncbi:hypothetical protein EUGRSUZ_G01385 [Eucalyptus grandis]|uniref:Uncharacterized protein n=2 Tax=Eucalyptus grandis TaxID=71139 RepID=A0ACC3K3M9_EUCGR|nr:hypothetical protein EUGRSUZ_G01385 [Eucalyptus grandis]